MPFDSQYKFYAVFNLVTIVRHISRHLHFMAVSKKNIILVDELLKFHMVEKKKESSVPIFLRHNNAANKVGCWTCKQRMSKVLKLNYCLTQYCLRKRDNFHRVDQSSHKLPILKFLVQFKINTTSFPK